MEHRSFDLNDALGLIAAVLPSLLTAFSVLLGIIFGVGLFKWIFDAIHNVLEELGDYPSEKAKNEKPKGMPVESEYDAQDIEEKPKRNPWKLGDDGEIITLDDLGIEAEDTNYFHSNQ